MKLDDSAIAHIAKTLQVAIITGTDIVDNLRQVEFVTENDMLLIDPDCAKAFSENLEKMLQDAEQMSGGSTI